jgi:hypothetical protein
MRAPFGTKSRLTKAAVSASLALVPATWLAFTSCSSAPKVEKATTVAYREGVPGGTLVETYNITVRVTDIDAASRKVTLVAPDGSRNTFAAKPTDRTFGRLRVGDQVQATVTREVVVCLRRDGAALSNGPLITVDLAPDSAESGALKSETVQRTATIGSVDSKRREATLVLPDGASRALPVRKDVDLQRLTPGEEVVIRSASAVVLTLEKP